MPERFHANTLKKLFPGIRVHRTYAELLRRPARAARHRRQRRRREGAAAARPDPGRQPGPQRRRALQGHGAGAARDVRRRRPRDRALRRPRHGATPRCAPRSRSSSCSTPITGLHERKVAAARRLAELDSYGVTLGGDTPLRLWLLRTHAPSARDRRGRQPRRPHGDRRRARGRRPPPRRALLGDLEAAKEAHRAAGGSTLQSLGALARAGGGRPRGPARAPGGAAGAAAAAHRRHRRRRRRTSRPRCSRPTTFAALQLRAQPVADRLPAGARRGSRRERDAVLRDRRYPLNQRQSELRRERTSLESRAGRMPARMHELRAEVAQASGLERSTSCRSSPSWSTSRPTRRAGARRSRPSSAARPG